jgi:hypothetical protein
VDEIDVTVGADGQIKPAHRPFLDASASEGLRVVPGFFEGRDVRLLQAGSGGRLPVDTGSIPK